MITIFGPTIVNAFNIQAHFFTIQVHFPGTLTLMLILMITLFGPKIVNALQYFAYKMKD